MRPKNRTAVLLWAVLAALSLVSGLRICLRGDGVCGHRHGKRKQHPVVRGPGRRGRRPHLLHRSRVRLRRQPGHLAGTGVAAHTRLVQERQQRIPHRDRLDDNQGRRRHQGKIGHDDHEQACRKFRLVRTGYVSSAPITITVDTSKRHRLLHLQRRNHVHLQLPDDRQHVGRLHRCPRLHEQADGSRSEEHDHVREQQIEHEHHLSLGPVDPPHGGPCAHFRL